MVSAVEGAHRAAKLARKTSAELERPWRISSIFECGGRKALMGRIIVASVRTLRVAEASRS
jgi:hypothetical protein